MLQHVGEPLRMNAFWSSCLRQLEQELPPQQFNTWIKALRLENGDESNQSLKLVAPNRFVLQWVRERYLHRLEDLAKQFFAEPVQISINLPESTELERLDVPPLAVTAKNESVGIVPTPVTVFQTNGSDSAYEKTRLNSTFTFDTLVTGRANDLARAAAYQVALNPGISYQPPIRIWWCRSRQNPPDSCSWQ
jgi:ATPase involved in DNA replication initiation